MSLLHVDHLKVYYPVRGGVFGKVVDYVRAVDDVGFAFEEGQSYGLVGESGSGKSTLAKAVLLLAPMQSGEIYFDNHPISGMNAASSKAYRRQVQMIFQDPYSSLNPKKRIREIIAEPLLNYEKLSRSELKERVADLLKKVHMSPDVMMQYPHQFSGGQRQRIGIARALALNPRLIIADEPVSPLDVSVAAQVLNYMKELQQELKLTFLFISHDLAVIRHMCSRVGVMVNGRMVEEGTTTEILEDPQHIYTKLLVNSIGDVLPGDRQKRQALRHRITSEFESNYSRYFDTKGRAYDMQKISQTRSVALPGLEGNV